MSLIFTSFSKPKSLLSLNPYSLHIISANSSSSNFKIFEKITDLTILSYKPNLCQEGIF